MFADDYTHCRLAVWWKLKAIGPPLLLVKKMQPRRTADFVRNKTKITLLFASPFPSIWNNIMTKLMNVLLYLHIRIPVQL
jgi:hypothetical protein